jgi:hypothetical protein
MALVRHFARLRLWTIVLGLGTLAAKQVSAESPDSAQALIVDLAGPENDSAQVTPGRYFVSVINLAPKYKYSASVSVEDLSILPLRNPFATAGNGCDALKAATKTLEHVDREENVAAAVGTVNTAVTAGGADPACNLTLIYARQLLGRTTYTHRSPTDIAVYRLGAGMTLRVRVTRTDATGGSVRVWERVFSTGPKGTWATTFGYAAVMTAGLASHGVFADQVGYTSKDIGDGKFVITPDRDPKRFDLVPAILFSFRKAVDKGGLLPGWTAGLGPDLTTPTVFLGVGWTYWSNLHLSVGAVMRREPRLLGRYSSGDTVTTNLTGDQLVEQVWQPRPYLSVSFRFADNIFKRSSGDGQPQPEKPAATPQTTPAKPESD